MSTSAIVGIVILVVAVVVLVAMSGRILVQRRELRQRYGDEYDRVVSAKGGRAAAEAELRRRERRHAGLELREPSAEARDGYRVSWTALQSEFVDDPRAAVRGADQLVSQLVADRGYPVVEFEDRLAHLSVEHAGVLHRYRVAHEISVRNDTGTATTEDLRRALVDYRVLAADLLGDPSFSNGAARTPPAETALPTSDMDVADAEPDAVADTDTTMTADAQNGRAQDSQALDGQTQDGDALPDRRPADRAPAEDDLESAQTPGTRSGTGN